MKSHPNNTKCQPDARITRAPRAPRAFELVRCAAHVDSQPTKTRREPIKSQAGERISLFVVGLTTFQQKPCALVEIRTIVGAIIAGRTGFSNRPIPTPIVAP